ncbi:MAG TPA: Asp-tRNA(Asn)/Glu-tRNA(Gln) amidotransferase subunit GatB, partial [Candidatus Paceibacterota bacterium]|nr:Asp-tRNA(Asn)/Glu-tRNA(Gln) amidotransferase subunit GatB [Candidatus Paceibacterota bacterium]
KQAGDFARELQLLLRTLGVSEANMEKGEMRVEANISLSNNEHSFGTKVEVKNLNSFRSAERAIEYELARMQALYEAGRESEIIQETRGWDETKQSTFSQRSKESAHDYRYFPDPDLPKLMLAEVFDTEKMKTELPELPLQKRERYAADFGIKAEDIEVFVQDAALADFYEKTVLVVGTDQTKTIANYITSDIIGNLKTVPGVQLPEQEMFAKLMGMVARSELTSRGAKDILVMLMKEGGDPQAIAKEHNMLQEHNEDALQPVIEEVVKNNEKIVADFKGGKEAALQALVGMVMKATKGSANPAVTAKLLRERIG